jgi:glycosyltransferase involved in cell wall biosynthesis
VVTEKRHLLRLITRLNIGGPARQALLLSKGLSDAYETTLAAGQSQPGEGELSDPEVAVTPVELGRSIALSQDVRAIKQVQRLLRNGNFQLLHTHMAKAGAVGRVAARADKDMRTVHTFHGHVLEGYFNPAVEKVFVQIERRLARQTDALVAVSPEIRDQLLDMRIGRPSQWHVIPLGFDLGPLLAVEGRSGELRGALGIGPEVPLVGALGRFAQIKAYPVLLDAIAKLDGVHLAILGDGELRLDLEQRTVDLGIRERVHFPGWWRDVPAALSDIDVVALTSNNEGTPVALIEGLAAARPVVATDVGGVPSVVDHGQDGLLVPKGDADAVARALRTLLEDPGLRAEMGAKGRVKARSKWDKQRLVRDIKDLYDDVLSRPSARAQKASAPLGVRR